MNKCLWGNVCEGEGGDKARVRNAKLRGCRYPGRRAEES